MMDRPNMRWGHEKDMSTPIISAPQSFSEELGGQNSILYTLSNSTLKNSISSKKVASRDTDSEKKEAQNGRVTSPSLIDNRLMFISNTGIIQEREDLGSVEEKPSKDVYKKMRKMNKTYDK